MTNELFLLNPAWLALAFPALGLAWFFLSGQRAIGILRGSFIVALLLALAGLGASREDSSGTVVVVADRSASMPTDSPQRIREIVDLLAQSGKPNDRLAVIEFGQKPQIVQNLNRINETAATWNSPDLNPDGSDLSEAIRLAKQLISERGSGRILVFSDGLYTGTNPLKTVFNASSGSTTPIDYRIASRSRSFDSSVERLDVPASVAVGQSFFLTGWVQMAQPGPVEYRLRRGAVVLAEGVRNCPSGRSSLVFKDRLGDTKQNKEPSNSQAQPNDFLMSTAEYQLEIKTVGNLDPIPENNLARTIVGVRKSKPILHLCDSGASGLGRILSASGLAIDSRDPGSISLDLNTLGQYRAVIIENVTASQVTSTGLDALKTWVESSGGGLLTTGGKKSYGLGGYFRSPIDPILPVSMELRKEHRKLSIGMVVVLDRSGSMAAPVGGQLTKMDLANEGAAQTLQLLSDYDQMGVIAVDSSSHVVVPLQGIENRDAMLRRIRSIVSEGGGIFVYEGLSRAAAMLSKSQSKTRHIILFADASDSEEPGAYKELLERCGKAGITCSVIALGRSTDCDAELLRDIAKRGAGRCFFTEKPEELPRLFTQETFSLARNTFLEEPVRWEWTPMLKTLTTQSFPNPAALGGFNVTYLRPGAELIARSQNSFKAPVVATQYCGLGRVACFTGQADGQYTGDFAAWPDLDLFYSSLVRWTAAEDSVLPPELLLTQEVSNGICEIRLHLPTVSQESDAAAEQDLEQNGELAVKRDRAQFWNQLFLGQKPKLQVVRALPGRPAQTDPIQNLEWLDGGLLGADVPIYGSETILPTVILPNEPNASLSAEKKHNTNSEQPQKPGIAVSMTPGCNPYSPEFRFGTETDGEQTLRRLADMTGGKVRANVTEIWKDCVPQRRAYSWSSWLTILAIFLFFLEILERRTRLFSDLVRKSGARPGSRKEKIPADKSNAIPKATVVPETVATPENSANSERKKAGGTSASPETTAPPETTSAPKAVSIGDILKTVKKR